MIFLTLSLPLGVHLFCLPKINEPNKRAAHARPAGSLCFSIWSGMTETRCAQTAVMLIRPALRCSALHKGIEENASSVVLVDPPFVLTSSGFLSGLETYLFERSEFGESP